MKALTLTFALLLICTGAVLAQTPDGLPPALETVCDAETGAAYGFCNAYCEAMDCDSAAPSASATACSKVRSKFENVAGRDVPCELSCPCTSIPAFNQLLSNINYCIGNTEVTLVSTDPVFPGPPFSFGPIDVAAPGQCGYFIFPTFVVGLPVTEEENAICNQILRDAAASRGVTCTGL